MRHDLTLDTYLEDATVLCGMGKVGAPSNFQLDHMAALASSY